MPDKKRPKVDSPAGMGKDAKKVKSDKKDEEGSGKESFNYDPVHFIRSHSKNNDPADIQTQIWEVWIRLLKSWRNIMIVPLTKFGRASVN